MTTETLNPWQIQPPERQLSDAILVCLLGGLRLLLHNQPLNVFMSGKTATLLSMLAFHLDFGVSRETLLDALWPEQEAAQSAVSLHSLVYSLQRRLHGYTPRATAVVYNNGSYFLNRDAGYSTDIAHFDILVARARRFAACAQDAAASDSFACAVDLYRGDLSAGDDVSAIIERERLRADFLSALAWLADYAYRSENYEVAAHHARRLLGCDPCREDAHRVVMRAYVRRGERTQALRQYRLCELMLRREFDVEPESLTAELFDRIRNDPTSI